MNSIANSSSPVVWFAVAVVIFLVLREVFTWYWKINHIVDLLERIERNTRKDIPVKDRDTQSTSLVKSATSEAEQPFSLWFFLTLIGIALCIVGITNMSIAQGRLMNGLIITLGGALLILVGSIQGRKKSETTKKTD